MSEIEDRRQRAFEHAEDMIMSGDRPSLAVTEAIEVATQVKITPEMIEEVQTRTDPVWPEDAENAIRVFCEVAGFEVIE